MNSKIRKYKYFISNPRPLFLLALLYLNCLAANNADSLVYTILKTDHNINIDGKLTDEAWTQVTEITRFIQREPANGQAASEKTVVKILYDKNNLYFGFQCYDTEVSKIVATEMRRDEILLNDDAVEIYLDTYHDYRTAFFFSTNALGAQRDGIIAANTDDQIQNWDWNGIWECASEITEDGWTAEIRIPFKTLRFNEAEIQTWGMNISRLIARKKEESYWAPITRDLGYWGKYRLDYFGTLTGMKNIARPEKLQLKPFLLTGTERNFEDNKPYESKLDIGLDAKYLLTTNLTIDLTVNTDFAQVEADQEQVNLSRFELFYPEKREFFLEGASTFRIGERVFSPLMTSTVLFFSRRIGLSDDNEIVPILGGVKMTGKTGSYELGLMNIFTNSTSYINDDDEEINIPQTNYTVFRAKKDMLKNSYLGVIGLNKESIDDNSFNRTYGVDGNFYITDQIQVSGMAAKTSSPDMKGRDLAFYGDFYYQDDFFTAMVAQSSIQDNFNPEMGFAPRTGIRRTHINFGVNPRPGIMNIRQSAIFSDFHYIAKQNNELESRLWYTGVWTLFNDGAQGFVMLSNNYEKLDEEFEIHDGVIIDPGIYKFNQFYGEYNSDLSQPVSGKVSIFGGEFFGGKIFGYGAGLNLKFRSRLTINLDYSHNNVDLTAGDFSTNLLSGRITYTFSPRMFLKTFVQYNSDRQVIIGNLLFNFIHTPGSDLYFVYNEELSTESESVRSLNRTILLKFTYLLNL